MKNQLRGQIISENNQVTFVDNYSHWKQLAQTTTEPQNSCDDSSLTYKRRHPMPAIATEPGEFLSFRLALARDDFFQEGKKDGGGAVNVTDFVLEWTSTEQYPNSRKKSGFVSE